MQLYFIRHGQSVNNRTWDENKSFAGRVPDPQITDLGRLQAHAAAGCLSRIRPGQITKDGDPANRHEYGITHLYSSLLTRAVETATIIGDQIGMNPVAWPDLHEWGGVYNLALVVEQSEGLPGPGRSYFETQFPRLALPETLTEAGWWNRGWESFDELPTRAERVVARLLERHSRASDRVALVGHGGFYNYFMGAVLGQLDTIQGPHLSLRFLLNNAAITRVDFKNGTTNLVYHNRTEHLSSELIS